MVNHPTCKVLLACQSVVQHIVSQPFMERMESRLEEREITAHVVQGIRLPRQGQYDLQLEFEDISIMRRPLTAILDHETPLGEDEPQKTA